MPVQTLDDKTWEPRWKIICSVQDYPVNFDAVEECPGEISIYSTNSLLGDDPQEDIKKHYMPKSDGTLMKILLNNQAATDGEGATDE